MTGNHYSHSKHLGSSLFEVLIVMAIVAILSALSLSSYLCQRQLVQSVREVMAFLAYQQQRSLLFNCKVQIVLWLSPINKLEAKSLTTPTTKESIQLGLNNQLIRSTATRFTFCGLRQTLRPMHFVLSNGDEEVKIIISSLGRIRACSQTIKAFSVC